MSVQSLIGIRKALNSLNPNHVRDLSAGSAQVTLHAPNEAAYREMEEFFLRDLRPARRNNSSAFLGRSGRPSSGGAHEIVVYHEGSLAPAGALVLNPAHPEHFIETTLRRFPDAGIPLARSFSPFRKPFVRSVVTKTARENTLFSLTTALPDVIPNILELPWAVAEFASDTAFLTMNQVRMAFLLAAASDREIGYREQKAEIASVIGGAFGWRALARQLVGKIPFGAGLIGKAAVAYAGTKVVGLSLDHLYSVGYSYTREERDQLYADAFQQGKKVAAKILSHTRPDIAARFFGDTPNESAGRSKPFRFGSKET